MKRTILSCLILAVIILAIPLLSFGGKRLVSPPDISDGERIYRVLNVKTGEIMRLSPSEYITGVVAAEMPVSFHSEALKAQAVAAHSYALTQMGQGGEGLGGAALSTDSEVYQAYYTDDELKERWGESYGQNLKKIKSAVDEVIGVIMVKDEAPIAAAFHSISGGTTESAENVWGEAISYLVPVKSEGDKLSPDYEKEIILSPEEVSFAVKSRYPEAVFSEDYQSWFEIKGRSQSGTVGKISVCGIELTGKELRGLLNLRSADFTVLFSDGSFKFTTKGYGHGVGMSQYGADFMARQGKGYKEILKHYYTGIEFKRLGE